jgi:hypothetical protein
MLKVSDECKRAIDRYYDQLDVIDNATGLTPSQKAAIKTETTAKMVKEPGWQDKIAEYVINSYISALGTPAVNLLSVIAKAPLLVAERAISSMIPGSQAKLGESLYMLSGMLHGAAESIHLAKAGFLRGFPLDQDPTADIVRRAIGGQSDASRAEQLAGAVIRVPTRVGTAVDEFSKGMFRRMELNALAYRISREVPEKQLGGKTRDDIFNELRSVNIGQVDPANNPLWKEAIKSVARERGTDIVDDVEDFAKTAVFQRQLGKAGNTILNFRKQYPLITLVVPFIKTPINIFKDALSYTPAALFMKQFKNDKQAAFARIALGSGIAALVYQNVVSGNITGAYPKDKAQREGMIAAGIPEYSLKIGDRWYSYARVEPLASVLGVFTDATEAMFEYYNKPKADQKMEELGMDMVLSITKNLTSKTFLEGLTGALQAIHDPDRFGVSFLESYANAIVPGAVAQVARINDPVQRDVQSFYDGLANRIPGLRQELPIRFDVTGQPRPNPAYTFLGSLGIATREETDTPVANALKEYGVGISMPSRKLRDVELSATDYEKYSKLSGDLVNERINAIIQNPQFDALTQERKRVLVKQAADKARVVASNRFHAEKMQADPEYYAEFIRQRRLKRGLPTE